MIQDDGVVREAMLDGSPEDLRLLASLLEVADNPVVIDLADGMATVRRELTADARLNVRVDPGPSLVVEGTPAAIGIITRSMREVAGEADAIGSDPVRRHAHVEYLGEDDMWRAPGSFPLIIGSDWPTSQAR